MALKTSLMWSAVTAMFLGAVTIASAQEPQVDYFTKEFAPMLGSDRPVSNFAVQSALASLLVANDGKLPCDAETTQVGIQRRFVTEPNIARGGTWKEEYRIRVCDRTYEQQIQVTYSPSAPPQMQLAITPVGQARLIQPQ